MHLQGEFSFTLDANGRFVRYGSTVHDHQSDVVAPHVQSRYRFVSNNSRAYGLLRRFADNLCQKLGAGQTYPLQALELLRQYRTKKHGDVPLHAGEATQRLLIACLYALFRVDHRPITMQDLAVASHLDIHTIGAQLKKLIQFTNIALPPPDPCDYLERTMLTLTTLAPEEKRKTQALAHRLMVFSDKMMINSGKCPLTITAAAVLVALESYGLLIATKAEERAQILALSLRITTNPIRARSGEIKRSLMDFLRKTLPWGSSITVVTLPIHIPAILNHFEWLQSRSSAAVAAPAPSPMLPSSTEIAGTPNEAAPPPPAAESLPSTTTSSSTAPAPASDGLLSYFDTIKPPLTQRSERREAETKAKIERARKRIAEMSNATLPLPFQAEAIDVRDLRISERVMAGVSDEVILGRIKPQEVCAGGPPRDDESLSEGDIPESEMVQYLRSDAEIAVASRMVHLVKETRAEATRKKRRKK
jgi:transcription initiation factor TFIIIB Brf1 subunit/transcription initiation factor TFIIB